MLQRCSSQYDLHRLLQLLADVDKLLKSNGPDFRKLSRLSQLLQGSDVSLSPRLLQCSSPSVQQEEFQAAVDALQARGRYTQARKVALLADLPVHHLLLSQLLQEMNSQKSKTTWRRLETRVSFWRSCQEQLKSDSTDPGSASCFFLSQADNPVSSENVQWQRWSTWNDVTISQSGLSDCEMVTFSPPIVLHWRVLTSRDSQAPVCGEENMAEIPCFFR
ncbi:spatacsin-like [Pleuronectes platessa]|uniref:spatacsin-like n=1 Tax=Pleuronectes platessa TaxID=8262 RepID=UPI00232A798C|nr:spatacsin-like [Pleuronectes platessa]XP_053282671.1 spatacsin-like [Pleuronectes platessa]XP_053282672.1 spatacsin-like [Pleuronectes platessa]